MISSMRVTPDCFDRWWITLVIGEWCARRTLRGIDCVTEQPGNDGEDKRSVGCATEQPENDGVADPSVGCAVRTKEQRENDGVDK